MPHPDFAKAAAHITADNVRDLLVDLVDIPSATGNEIGVAHYLVERMRKSGLASDLPLRLAARRKSSPPIARFLRPAPWAEF